MTIGLFDNNRISDERIRFAAAITVVKIMAVNFVHFIMKSALYDYEKNLIKGVGMSHENKGNYLLVMIAFSQVWLHLLCLLFRLFM